MNVRDHLRKVERIEATRRKLDPVEDYELWYFATLAAAVSAMNAALHALGATVAEDCFAHNVPVYFKPGAAPGTFAPMIRPFGDIEHVDSPEMEALIPPALDQAREALKRIEELREASVRGEVPDRAAAAARVDSDYHRCLACARETIEREGVAQ